MFGPSDKPDQENDAPSSTSHPTYQSIVGENVTYETANGEYHNVALPGPHASVSFDSIPTSKSHDEASQDELDDPEARVSTDSDELEGHDMSRTRSSYRSHEGEEWDGIRRIVSTMFGRSRRETSEEEQTRHLGVVWKNLTVKGVGLGATLQKTNSDILLGLPRLLLRLVTGNVRKKEPIRTILDGFTGCVRPGEMLLVLGQPGSGCSTLLKVLGNQRAGYRGVTGDVTYGGTDWKTMAKKYRSEVLYNPEEDLHYATLSVRDTLKFAIKTRTPGKESRMENESRSHYQDTFLNSVAKLFWIEHCLDTKVGNNIIRGVSGGEKKRVSIAEALITKASTQCWDNSTKGLDASTALEYVQSLRSLTDMTQVSTIVAIYQASERLFTLFDKVVLLIDGKCAYFGPASHARAYFEELGYEPAARSTTADFLTSVTERHARKIKEGYENRAPRSPAQFKEAYTNSESYQANLRSIEEFEQETESQAAEREAAQRAVPKKNFTISFFKQVMVLSRRQFLVMIGDKKSLFGKWAVVLFLALIVGSLFYDLPPTSQGVFTRGGILFYMILFNALLAMAEMTIAFQSRPIITKHKNFSFYRPSAYALAQVFVDLPQTFVQVAIFGIITYFMSNLTRTPGHFFTNFLFLWTITMTMYSFFRAIAAMCGSLDIATRITGVAIQALIVYTGYLIPPRRMRPWLKWLIWINPVQYCFEGLMSNEFHNLNIQCVPPFVVPAGQTAVPGHQSCLIQGSVPDQTVVRGDDYISSNFTYTYSHVWRNFGIMLAFLLFFILLTMLGTEYHCGSGGSSRGGGSMTVFMRNQAPSSVKSSIEDKKSARDDDTETGEGNSAAFNESDFHEEIGGITRSSSAFTWQDINYQIPYKGGERKLLQHVSGYVVPGRLTALVGASGAGKTTLLNALAQRINFGVITGQFLVDGKPLPKSFQRATGFAEQEDIHEPTATVRESLRFSALLRQPRSVSKREKYEYCERIIDLLELKPIAGAVIGQIGAGLNPEQRKRVTIGVELASKPELLLFLDEPTSGLDSVSAFNIVRFLRKLADVGQAVLCTIHQPSSILFSQFDDLLLLQSGGRTVYHGPLGEGSEILLHYFQSNGAKKCPSKANPAEYMLEVIGAGNPDYNGPNWADIWDNSGEHRAREEEIDSMVRSRTKEDLNSRESSDDREFAMPLWTQILATTKRSFVCYWRTPNYTLGKFMLHIWTGLFNTFTFWHLTNSAIDMQSRLFSVFMTLVIAPPLIQQLQPRYFHFRGLYEAREANSKIYSWFALVTSIILPELPYSIVAGSIYFCCWYFGTWFPRNSFAAGYTWMLLMLFEVFYVGLGQILASMAPNELFASLLVPAFFTFVVSFCGVVVPYAAMPYFWRSWMYWLTPFHYLLEGFLGVITHNVPVKCDENEYARFTPPSGISCDKYAGPFAKERGGYVLAAQNGMCKFCQYANGGQFAASFHVFYRHRWRDYGIFFSYVIFNFLVVYLLSWVYLHGVPSLKKKVNAWKMNRFSKAKG